MFTVEERAAVLRRLLELAAVDDAIPAAAITGSCALDASDGWSDIDLALAVTGELSAAMARWTETLYREFGALHHWDLPSGPSIYRVFLLADWLEIDVAFTLAEQFGPRGPQWRMAFGAAVPESVAAADPTRRAELVGMAWHHVLHARVCIERGKPWQAEWLIANLRAHVLALACLRLGHVTRFAKGADLLPHDVTAPLEATLVRSLAEAELRRALRAGADALATELDLTDPAFGRRLRPMLAEIAPLS